VLSKGNVKATDPYTVELRLGSPNGNFPYLVSSDNYNAIILPKTYNGGWDKTFIGTGPWKLQSFVANQGVTYVRNPHYWGPPTVAVRSQLTFYPEEQAQTLGLQGNQVTASPTTRSRRASTAHRPQHPDDSVPLLSASTDPHAQRQGAVHG
jgi:peptide/nickel transport system substrate-binding protein